MHRKISSSRAGCIVLQSTRNFIGDTAEKGPFNVAPLLARWPVKERSDVLSLFEMRASLEEERVDLVTKIGLNADKESYTCRFCPTVALLTFFLADKVLLL